MLRIATNKKQWLLVAQTKEKLKSLLRYELDGLLVRSRQNQNGEEETASIFHQNKVIKKDLTKLKVPLIGPVREGEERQLEITNYPQRIEEHLTRFFNALLKGRLDKDMEDTGRKLQPDFTHLDE